MRILALFLSRLQVHAIVRGNIATNSASWLWVGQGLAEDVLLCGS
jgi:hypothetical protein